jgi:CubicO group peptidase (beta-lactamase class C family)
MINQYCEPMLADRLNDAVHNAHAVGAVAGTLHKGTREYAAAGTAFPGRPMTPQTSVRIASITKPMMAMAVFTAFRTEPDALDAPLSEHLPDLKPHWRLGDDVTLRRCLSHTAGLRSADDETLAGFGDGDDALDQAVRFESRLPTAWRPGRAWAYCNTGFRFAGAVLARKQGTTFEQAIAEILFVPAGMDDTGFVKPEGGAAGHRKGVPQPDGYSRSRRPGGGLWSTAKDLLSFADYAMRDEKFMAEARKEHSPAAMGHRYGLGWFLNGRADVIFHFGDVGGFQGLLAVAPDHGTAAVAVGNDEHGGKLSRAVAFLEIANRTGLQRPRPAPKRLAYAAIRSGAARVIA